MLTEGAFAYLPAGEILERGSSDLARGVPTLEALLVAMIWPRLESLGLLSRDVVEPMRSADEDFELRAYRLLSERLGADAHGRFLALSSELESALNALDRERGKASRLERAAEP